MNGHIVHRLEPQPEPSADLSPPTSATSARASMSRWVGAQPRWLFTKRQRRDMTGSGVGALSGGFEAGREPGVAAEEVAEGVEFADAPFRGGGEVGLDEGELGESFEGP